jgi:hypothetical protein
VRLPGNQAANEEDKSQPVASKKKRFARLKSKKMNDFYTSPENQKKGVSR